MKVIIQLAVSAFLFVVICSSGLRAGPIDRTINRQTIEASWEQNFKMAAGRFQPKGRYIEKKKQIKPADNPFVRRNGLYLAPPGNDDFADRFTLSGPSGSTAGSNVDATLDVDLLRVRVLRI